VAELEREAVARERVLDAALADAKADALEELADEQYVPTQTLKDTVRFEYVLSADVRAHMKARAVAYRKGQ
jgi:hypothetical protein